MSEDKTTLERAFELAKSGTCLAVNEIRRALKSRGYAGLQVAGATLGKQLRGLIEPRNSSYASVQLDVRYLIARHHGICSPLDPQSD